MTQLVYRSIKNGAALVYEGMLNTGVTYAHNLTTTESSVGTIAYSVTSAGSTKFLTLTTTQDTSITLAKALNPAALLTTQSSIIDVYTDTALLGSVGNVNQSSVSSVVRQIGKNITAIQNSTASVALSVTIGTAHSTFFITALTTQAAVASINKGIQTQKQTTQAAAAFISGLFNGARLANLNIALAPVAINAEGSIGKVAQLAVTLGDVTIYARGTQPGKIINVPQSQMSGQGKRRVTQRDWESYVAYRDRLREVRAKPKARKPADLNLKTWQKTQETKAAKAAKTAIEKATAQPPLAPFAQLAPDELAPTAKALKISLAQLRQAQALAQKAQEEDDLAALMLVD